jgi:glutamate N-acetyltransferase/amino-acid N-acetyltransferase
MASSNKLSVPGFLVGGLRGKKYGLALVFSKESATSSLMVTTNKIRAAPVELSLEHSKDNSSKGVVITSGNANAFTGERGKRDALRICELTAETLGINKREVIVNSTGIIGQWLEMDEIESLIRDVSGDIRNDDEGISKAADAMMTTDAFSKISTKNIEVDGRNVKITGIAKGAGMIAPKLGHATMISVILTDAYIPRDEIDGILKEAVDKSFNMLVVDGDTSTNDMVVLLANGKAGNKEGGKGLQLGVNEVCTDLAKMIAKDGEGATKFFQVKIEGAKSIEDAKKAARAVAGSTLVKTALFGENPNWGRVIAAVGYSGAEFSSSKLSLKVGSEGEETVLVRDGFGVALKGTDEIKRAGKILKSTEINFKVDLGVGKFSAMAFGCDLGYNYVKVNAEYTS